MSADQPVPETQFPYSARNRFRVARFGQFMAIVNAVLEEKGSCRILDVGGTVNYWLTFAPDLPAGVHVTIANLEPSEETDDPRFTQVSGDACDMREFPDGSFDIVHSNSVIEHVGIWNRMSAMAREVRRLAPRYFVQTPNYWFPIEAHSRYPFFHFLPEPWRRSLLMRRRRGFWGPAGDVGAASDLVHNAILLDYHQMAHLFPDANIVREKVFGLSKSLIAVRQ